MHLIISCVQEDVETRALVQVTGGEEGGGATHRDYQGGSEGGVV